MKVVATLVRPLSAIKRFRCPTCNAKRGQRCTSADGRTHKTRRSK